MKRTAVAAILAALFAACGAPPPAATPAPLAIRALCFAPATLELPGRDVRERVAALTPGLVGDEAAWIRALVTHESGGDATAISPTGCAGPLALLACRGCSPCCIADRGDHGTGHYDLCRSEVERGYLCDRGLDPRFRPAFAVAMGRTKLGGILERLGRAPAGSFDAAVAVAAAWNAGPGIFAGYPAGLVSPEAAIEHLEFARSRSYAGWAPADLWNKVVELHDYARWLALLRDAWRDPATVAPPEAAGEVCFAAGDGRFRAAARPAGDGRRVAVRRLRFGRYLPDTVEVFAEP